MRPVGDYHHTSRTEKQTRPSRDVGHRTDARSERSINLPILPMSIHEQILDIDENAKNLNHNVTGVLVIGDYSYK